MRPDPRFGRPILLQTRLDRLSAAAEPCVSVSESFPTSQLDLILLGHGHTKPILKEVKSTSFYWVGLDL